MLKKGLLLGAIGAAFLMLGGARVAKADSFTLYCTGGNTCFTSNSGLTSYWTLQSTIGLTAGTFDYKLDVSETGEANPGYLNDFSGQLFFGSGAGVSGLAMPENPGSWTNLQASKAGNNGSCNGSANGAFCASDDTGLEGTPVALGTTPVEFEVTGDYTGTYLSNGTWNFQAAASLNNNDSRGNVFAVSLPVGGGGGGTTSVPEPSSGLLMLGSGLVALGVFGRRLLLA
jgi:PEP-CTERM motif